jgi:flagellar biosynthesis/type III secretory pathway protein FliH
MVPGAGEIEIALHPEDIELLSQYDQKFQDKYPGLHFVSDSCLRVGDCIMRTRFGVVDGRLETKLDNLSSSLR